MARLGSAFEEWQRERLIRKTLRRLSCQRVGMVLRPGNIWVIEKALNDYDDGVAAALRTCLVRGWVEVLQDSVPAWKLTPEGRIPEDWDPSVASKESPIFRLTEAGWSVIHRSHEWVVATFLVATATLIGTVIGILVTSLSD